MEIMSTNVAVSAFFCLLVTALIRARSRSRFTKLKGPPTLGVLFGLVQAFFKPRAYSDTVEEWERQYGSVFRIPAVPGMKNRITICDPKAIMHHWSNDTYTYRQPLSTRLFFETFFGRSLVVVDEDTHKRYRKALAPSFSNATIRDLSPIFYDLAYMVKNAWDSVLQSSSSDESTIEIQEWMNHMSLDAIGMAGFSHDFESLKGKSPPVVAALDSFGDVNQDIPTFIILVLGHIFPSLLVKVPTKRQMTMKSVSASIGSLAGGLIESARVEKDQSTDRSIIGMLVKSESVASASSRLTIQEIKAQTFLLILAGYETTAVILTWTIVELCRRPDIQQKLREELAQFSTEDPTYDQLTNDLPLLHAVVCEVLRLYPPVNATVREAYVDDVIPLSKPISTSDGKVVDSVAVAKGTVVHVPIATVNRSEVLWGPNAKNFDPDRWLDNSISQHRASEIQGYGHLLSFGGGARMCLGKAFALTEIKTVLSVLIRNYTFKFPDGPSTKVEVHRSFLLRPKVVGQDGPRVPVIVRRVE